jgi:hypothetical protein
MHDDAEGSFRARPLACIPNAVETLKAGVVTDPP